MMQAGVAYELPQIGTDFVQSNGFATQKGVVYLQQTAQPQQQVRFVQQQQPMQQQQQQVWVQAAAPQQQPQMVQLRQKPQYVVQQAAAPQQQQPQQHQQQLVYLQQAPQQAQPQLRQVQPQQVMQQAAPAPAPAGQAVPGQTVLVNINGTLRQAVVGQNGALFLVDGAKPAMVAPQPQAAQQPAVQYLAVQPQQQQQLQQPQRVQMMVQQAPQGVGVGPQFVMRSAAPMQAAAQIRPMQQVQMASNPMQFVQAQALPQQGRQQVMLTANGALLQQQQLQAQMLQQQQQRPTVQMVQQAQMLAASQPQVVMLQQANSQMMMPQQLNGGANPALGMMRPPAAAHPALSAAMAAPLPSGSPLTMQAAAPAARLNLAALQVRVARTTRSVGLVFTRLLFPSPPTSPHPN
jgi:hypothetical protein